MTIYLSMRRLSLMAPHLLKASLGKQVGSEVFDFRLLESMTEFLPALSRCYLKDYIGV